MSIPAEYLNGLEDVAAQLRAIMDGTFLNDAIIPEPTATLVTRLTEHVRLMSQMYPDANLMRFADVANQAEAWAKENA